MLSYNVPEEKWTEKTVKTLPGEDDRFEYKEEIDIEKISQEICAFANSFGGTLFLGIEDKNGVIKGVDKLKGNKPTTLWLEQTMPTKLEFRFGSFRIQEVKLTPKTQKKIGQDKVVISIDVFDSDLAPYQVVQTRKYYRRENTSSKEAPHSYLAYLWGRNSTDKTRVVQHWVTDFLSPLILSIERLIHSFQYLDFYGSFQTIDNANFIVLHPIDWQSWTELTNKISGKQFLRTYNYLEEPISNFSSALREFDDFMKDSEETFLRDEKIQNVIRERYELYLKRHQVHNNNIENLNHILLLLLSELQLSFRNDISLAVSITSRYIMYVVFGFKFRFVDTKDEAFKNYCVDLVNESEPNHHLEIIRSNMEKLRNNVLNCGNNLIEQADSLRHELCLRHNTIY